MAEDKKSDDYTVEMNKLDSGNKEFEAAPPPSPSPRAGPVIPNHPAFPVLAYCGSSIMMTVMNKYVLSGLDFNLNFLLLCVQVCGGFAILIQGELLISIVFGLHCCNSNMQVHGSYHLP
jgi:hypothetical protein